MELAWATAYIQLTKSALAERWLEAGAEYAQKESALPAELQEGLSKTRTSHLSNGGVQCILVQ